MEFHQRPFKLREFKIEVTHYCPLACVHCSSDAAPSSKREMSREQCLEILREGIAMGAKEVAFSGGEPLTWPPLNKCIEVAAEGGLKVLIYTSGNIDAPKQRMKELSDLGVTACIFSIFGSTDARHETITRKKGSFSRTKYAIREANNSCLLYTSPSPRDRS